MDETDPIFRSEALNEYRFARRPNGELLAITPRWLRLTYYVSGAFFVAIGAFMLLAVIPDYAEGPAIVRARQRSSVTATASGVVTDVLVSPGTIVKRGDILVKLHSAEEQAAMASAHREFNAALVRLLIDPLDVSARQVLTAARTNQSIVTARLADRSIRAPADGVVGDIRIHEGGAVAMNDIVLSISSDHAAFDVVAVLPGDHRPSLWPGQELSLNMTGYAQSYQTATVRHVTESVLGPTEVRRLLGSEFADAIQIPGAVVVVTASLSKTDFTAGEHTYPYFDGMQGVARVKLRAERLVWRLFPETGR